MEDLLVILREINPDVDYETCDRLVEDGHITSMQIVMLVGEINQEFGVAIPADKILPEYFNSAKSLYALIQELEEE